jgi:hypothetical protein
MPLIAKYGRRHDLPLECVEYFVTTSAWLGFETSLKMTGGFGRKSLSCCAIQNRDLGLEQISITLQSHANQLASSSNLSLGKQLLVRVFHRALRDVHAGSNLLVREPLNDQAKSLKLPVVQTKGVPAGLATPGRNLPEPSAPYSRPQ